MTPPLLLLTGFGPFPGVSENPSGALVDRLLADPPAGVELAGGVLPVAFERVPAAYDALVDEAGGAPDGLLSLGVHRGAAFRLELRARGKGASEREDADGAVAAGVVHGDGAERATSFDLSELAAELFACGAREVHVSDDAGGYVCERTYHHVLTRAEERAVPGLFLHVPPVEHATVDEQLPVVRGFVAALAARL